MERKALAIGATVTFAVMITGFVASLWTYTTNTPSGKSDIGYGWSTAVEKNGNSVLIIALGFMAIVSFSLVVASYRSKKDSTALFAVSLLGLIGSIIWLSLIVGDLNEEDRNALVPITVLLALLILIGAVTSFGVVKTLRKEVIS